MKKDIRIKKFYEKTVETWFLLCAIIAILFLGIISIYLFLEGTPAIFKIGLKEFILGSKWM